jgi:hypothetical protein
MSDNEQLDDYEASAEAKGNVSIRDIEFRMALRASLAE